MGRSGWTRLSARGLPTCFGRWLYEPNGCAVLHCGHPTAIWPYYIVRPGSTKILVAPNGHGFRTLKLAMDAAERL
jgi:hypothetical protein